MSAAMPADLAEAVRSMPCGACQAPRGAYCPCEGTHLARWELAVASALVSERDYHAAAKDLQWRRLEPGDGWPVLRYAGVMRYPDGGGLDAAERA
ncbi:MAG: hypothetical protein ACR2MP_01920, partial [Streptosporangiaceae bacterium]